MSPQTHGLTGTDTTHSSPCFSFTLSNAAYYPRRIRIRIADLSGQRSYVRGIGALIAVFPILADVVEVKTGSRSTAHWSNDFMRLNGWLRNCFAQLITPLDIDGIGQNWEDSNTHRKKQIRWAPSDHNPMGQTTARIIRWGISRKETIIFSRFFPHLRHESDRRRKDGARGDQPPH